MPAISPVEWIVILAGAAAIAWVNWYFFVAGRTRTATADAAPDPASRDTEG